jgi:hypothetical protein
MDFAPWTYLSRRLIPHGRSWTAGFPLLLIFLQAVVERQKRWLLQDWGLGGWSGVSAYPDPETLAQRAQLATRNAAIAAAKAQGREPPPVRRGPVCALQLITYWPWPRMFVETKFIASPALRHRSCQHLLQIFFKQTNLIFAP